MVAFPHNLRNNNEVKLNDIKYEEGRLYLRAWIEALAVFLGWSKAKTLRWAEQWADALNREHDLLFHETPTGWIANLLIPRSIKVRLPGNQLVYVRQILCAVVHKEDSLCDVRPDFNWKLAKARVDEAMHDIQRQLKESDVDMEDFLLKYRTRIYHTKPMPKDVAKLFKKAKRKA